MNTKNLTTVLSEIQKNYCSACHYGGLTKLIGYKSNGTCLDYVYDIYKVPYSIAWEIYTNETVFPEMMQAVRNNNLENTHNNANEDNNLENTKETFTGFMNKAQQNANIDMDMGALKTKQSLIKNPYKFKQSSSFLTVLEADKFVDMSYTYTNLNASKKLLRNNEAETTTVRKYTEYENNICIELFNPLKKAEYDFIISTWSKSLIHLLNYVHSN